jgi:hypothetical protein
MHRRLLPALLGLLLTPPALAAQLPMVTVPNGTLQIAFGGGFFPTDHQWVSGHRQPLGGLLTTTALGADRTPLLADLSRQLTDLTGRAAGAFSLGGLTATAEQERGIGTLGLGLGVSSRISLFMTVPIVMVRSRYQMSYDTTGATVGLNPSHPSLGNSAGQAQATAFFVQFDTALSTLAAKVVRGDFVNTPATLALAQQTLTDGAALRSALYLLLADPTRAMPVLPTAASADGTALLARIASFRNSFSSQFGVNGFTASPALPDAPLTSQAFNTLLTSPDGFGRAVADDRPRTALGDIEAGVAVQWLQRGTLGDRWLSVWSRGLVRFPNGSLPRATQLFDQGTGDRQFDAELSGIVEVGRGAFGLRSEVTYTHQFARVMLGTIGAPDQLLVPTYRAAALSQDLGDMISVSAQPFVRMAPHLALTGLASYWRKGADQYAYATGQGEIAGAALSELGQGTAADAFRVGLGLSYVHLGETRGTSKTMPVEAGFSIERTIASGRGLVSSPLTTRMTFRLYKQLFTR